MLFFRFIATSSQPTFCSVVRARPSSRILESLRSSHPHKESVPPSLAPSPTWLYAARLRLASSCLCLASRLLCSHPLCLSVFLSLYFALLYCCSRCTDLLCWFLLLHSLLEHPFVPILLLYFVLLHSFSLNVFVASAIHRQRISGPSGYVCSRALLANFLLMSRREVTGPSSTSSPPTPIPFGRSDTLLPFPSLRNCRICSHSA